MEEKFGAKTFRELMSDDPIKGLRSEINSASKVIQILEDSYGVNVDEVRTALGLAKVELNIDLKQAAKLVVAVRLEIFRALGSHGIFRRRSEEVRAYYRVRAVPKGRPFVVGSKFRLNSVEHIRLDQEGLKKVRAYLTVLGEVNLDTEMAGVARLLSLELPQTKRFVDGRITSFGIPSPSNFPQVPESNISLLIRSASIRNNPSR